MAAIVLSLIGPPGSGKTTVGRAAAHRLGLEFLGIGEALRKVREDHPGLSAALAAGQLAPETLVRELVEEFLVDRRACVLDGYPRYVDQLIHLEKLGAEVTLVSLRIDAVLAADRIAVRVARPDDSDAAIAVRVARDRHDIKELLKRRDSQVRIVDASQPLEAVIADVLVVARLLKF